MRMLRVLLHDAEPDYLEALRTYLGARLPCLRPDVVLETPAPDRASGAVSSASSGASCDFLVYNPDDGSSPTCCVGVPPGRTLRLVPGDFSPPSDEGSVARLGGADRILAALLRGLPAVEAPVREPDPVDVAPVRSETPSICLLSSLPAAVRQALSMVAAEALATRGYDVDYLEFAPLDPDGRGLAPDLLPPLPGGLPSITDLLLDPEGLPLSTTGRSPAYLLAPRRADDLFECPPSRIAEAVRNLLLRPTSGSRLLLAVCGEVPFSLVREVARVCGCLLLVHGDDSSPACRALRHEVSLMLPFLPAGLRFVERVLPIDPTRPREADWAECARILRSDLHLSDTEVSRGAVR